MSSTKIKWLKPTGNYEKGEEIKASKKHIKELKDVYNEGEHFEILNKDKSIKNKYTDEGIVPKDYTKVKTLINLHGEEFKEAFLEKQKEIRKKGLEEGKEEEIVNFSEYGIEETITFIYSDKEAKAKSKVKQRINSWADKKELAKEIYKIKPFFFDSGRIWWTWNNEFKKWEKVDKTDILNLVSNNSEADTINSTDKSEILEAMKQIGRNKMPKEPPKSWVQFKDTIVDLENDKKFKATPKYFMTNPIPWEIGNSEETPKMDKIFEEWVGKDYKRTLYEIIAYCALPDYPIHRLFCLVGEGRNGKSCFQRLVKRFIGNSNITSTDLSDLVKSRFEKAKLYKKLVCILGETNFSTITRTSLIKRLTGQDSISFEFKRKDPIDDVNYAKIIIATNGLPYSEDQSDGFYRRWCIVEFPNKFKGEKDILDEIPKEEYNNLVKKCIGILKELLDKRNFHKEGDVEKRKKKYEDLSNPVSKFIEEMCKREGEVPFFKFYEELGNFIEGKNYRQLSKIEVSKILNREGFDVKTKRKKKPNGKATTWKMIMGLSLDYGGNKPRYVVKKDMSDLYIDEEIKEKRVEDIIVESDENKDLLRTLEKEEFIEKLGGENEE